MYIWIYGAALDTPEAGQSTGSIPRIRCEVIECDPPPIRLFPCPVLSEGGAWARNRIRGPGLSVWGPTGAGGQSDDGNATGRRSQTPSGLRTRKRVELKPAGWTVLPSTRRVQILVMTRMHGIITGAVNRCAACVAWGSPRGKPSRACCCREARNRESSLPSTPSRARRLCRQGKRPARRAARGFCPPSRFRRHHSTQSGETFGYYGT
jgi:hypothetical protein